MPEFEYRGRDGQGGLVRGRLEGSGPDAVASQLLNTGITPVSIVPYQEQEPFSERLRLLFSGSSASLPDLIMFSRQMYTITHAGVPLIRGVRSIAASLDSYALRTALNDIAQALESGMELSAAMRRHPKVFSDLIMNIVAVGESSGQLDQAFIRLAEYLERDLETRRRIKSAIRYPSFVIGAMAVAVVVINMLVIPAFTQLFQGMESQLPLPTKILIGVSDFFNQYWPHLLVATGLAWAGLRAWLGTEDGAYRWGRMKLRLWLIGDVIRRASLARYARTFALMSRSGVPLPQALELCARVIDNPYLGEKIRQIRSGVERGENLYRTHAVSQMFTPLVLQMIAVGEESGLVDELLDDVAGFYEREVDYDVKKLADRIEPTLIVVLAGMVLVLMLAIFLPVWEMYSLQRG